MKKKYAFNTNTGEKLFCKVDSTPAGVLVVDYYLPQYGFSVTWERDSLIRIIGLRGIKDGNRSKTIVSFKVHPTYFVGDSFSAPIYRSTQDAIDEIFTKYIKTSI